MNERMTKLQHESVKLRATSPLLIRQHLQQPSGGNANTNNSNTVTAGNPGTISDTMEEMLMKYNYLDEESKKALMHHAITSNNETLQ